MKVAFKGMVELPYADDRGTYDIWLLNRIAEAIQNEPEHDDVYVALNLSWEIVKDD